MTGIVGIGATSSCLTTGLNIPIAALGQGIIVFAASTTGLSLTQSITGYASAGLSLS